MLACIVVAGLTACDNNKDFKVEGEIQSADGKYVVLEKPDFAGQWIPIDSALVDKSADFAINAPAPDYPEIYRLKLNNKYIYFPIDSIETVSVKSSYDKFGIDFSLSGSANAEKMAAFEKELMALNTKDTTKVKQFKKDVYTKYMMDARGSIVSYYVLTKFVDGHELYNSSDIEDAKYFAAVATQFDQYRPNDPHGRLVKNVSISAMRNRNSQLGKKTVISANEVKVIDVTLPDENAKKVKLSDVVGKRKPVVVIFSLMNEPESPEFNRSLHSLYTSANGAVEFYQISFDSDQYQWRDAARNLPWITVFDPDGMTSTALTDYNVTAVPVMFYYDANGDLIDRADNLDQLAKLLRK